MAHEQLYRSGTSRVLAVAAGAIAAVGLVSILVSGSWSTVARWTAPLLLVAVIAWLAYWRPYVRLDGEGVELQNVLGRVSVPWAELLEIHSRYGLQLETRDGRRWQAWAAPSPVGMQRARNEETEASILVRRRFTQVVERGELRPSDNGVRADRDIAAIVLLAALLLATAIGLLVG